MAWYSFIDDLFKGSSKGLEEGAAKSVVKTASSDVVKTTSKLAGSESKLVSGGTSTVKTAVKDLAKGVGSTAKVGGKVLGASVIVGGTSLGAAKVYNYVADEWAKTTAQREYENQIKLAGAEADTIKKAQQNQIDYFKQLSELQNDGSSVGMGASGGGSGGLGSLFPMMPSAADQAATAQSQASSSKTMWLVLGGLGLLATGTFIYSKSTKLRGGK